MSDLCVVCGRGKFQHTFKEVENCKKQEGKGITTLRVRKITRDILATIGTKEMSFDEIIMQLLNSYEKEHGK